MRTRLPSIFSSSFSNMTSINSSSGTLDSSAATPFPYKLRLNRPSPPNTADERFFLASIIIYDVAQICLL